MIVLWVMQWSYRTDFDSPLNQLFKDFQMQFLIKKYPDTEIIDISPALEFSLLKYESISVEGWQETVSDSIHSYIKGYDLHPNDVVILSLKFFDVRQLNEYWTEQEDTHCMFETYKELALITNKEIDELKSLNKGAINILVKQDKNIERERKTRKNHFYANSGKIKFSTIHSYKGLESKTVFYVMGEKDKAEIVYTSITRSSENLVIFDVGSKNICSDFFMKHIK